MSNDTSAQKEKLRKEIKELDKAIIVASRYCEELADFPTGEGEVPEFKEVPSGSGIIPKIPFKDLEENGYSQWYLAWQRILPIYGKFKKIYNRFKDELRPILEINYGIFCYTGKELRWWNIHEDINNLLDKIQNIHESFIELRDKKRRDEEHLKSESVVEEKRIEGFAAFRKTQQAERWTIDRDEPLIYYKNNNTKHPITIKLAPLEFSVFCRLHKKIGNDVKIKTLAKCWKEKPDYAYFVQDCVSKIKNKIRQELKKHKVKDYGDIIKPDKPKNTKAYKLLD